MPKKLINQEELIFLATTPNSDGKYPTHQELADAMNVSRPAITRALQRVPSTLLEVRSVDQFIAKRAQMFAEIQQQIVRYITPEKLKNASLNQLGTLFGIFYDKERLETNQTTANIAAVNVHAMDDDTKKFIAQAIQASTQKKLKEAYEDK